MSTFDCKRQEHRVLRYKTTTTTAKRFGRQWLRRGHNARLVGRREGGGGCALPGGKGIVRMAAGASWQGGTAAARVEVWALCRAGRAAARVVQREDGVTGMFGERSGGDRDARREEGGLEADARGGQRWR